MIVPVQRKLRQRRSCCSSGSELARLGYASASAVVALSPMPTTTQRLGVETPATPSTPRPWGWGDVQITVLGKTEAELFFFQLFTQLGAVSVDVDAATGTVSLALLDSWLVGGTTGQDLSRVLGRYVWAASFQGFRRSHISGCDLQYSSSSCQTVCVSCMLDTMALQL